MEIDVQGQKWLLLKEKAAIIQETQSLVISDLHIGKDQHFRKHGLPVPGAVGRNNLWRLSGILAEHPVKEIIFLGDLFHSKLNAAWDVFGDFLANYPQLVLTLVKGNHDILDESQFMKFHIRICDSLQLDSVLLSHERIKNTELYNIHGHIHPGVNMRGKGRQFVKAPCFFFSEKCGIMPSFGDFTGMHALKPKNGDNIYIPLSSGVVQVC